MVLAQLLYRYPFFTDFNYDQLRAIARAGKEKSVEQGHYFFHYGDIIHNFYLVLEGEVAFFIAVPDHTVTHTFSMQLTRNVVTTDVTVSTIGPGEIFGWCGFLPQQETTVGAKTIKPSRVVQFDCEKLRPLFEKDTDFAYRMVLKTAQVIHEQLSERQIESLSVNMMQAM